MFLVYTGVYTLLPVCLVITLLSTIIDTHNAQPGPNTKVYLVYSQNCPAAGKKFSFTLICAESAAEDLRFAKIDDGLMTIVTYIDRLPIPRVSDEREVSERIILVGGNI